MKLNSMISAIVLAVSAGAASATTYTFDFDTGLGSDHASLHVASNEDAGFGVTIQAFHYSFTGSGYTLGGAVDVDTNSYGLISDNENDRHTIDSYGTDELMKFTFDGGKEVTLTSIVISWYEGTGWYDLFADGSFVGNTKDGSVLPAGPANMFSVGARTITQLALCHSYDPYGYYQCKKDYETGFKIRSITVTHEDPPGGVIPLPATGWLMLGALGGLGALRRRKARV